MMRSNLFRHGRFFVKGLSWCVVFVYVLTCWLDVPSFDLMQIAQDMINVFNPFGGLEGGRAEDPYDFVNYFLNKIIPCQ